MTAGLLGPAVLTTLREKKRLAKGKTYEPRAFIEHRNRQTKTGNRDIVRAPSDSSNHVRRDYLEDNVKIGPEPTRIVPEESPEHRIGDICMHAQGIEVIGQIVAGHGEANSILRIDFNIL